MARRQDTILTDDCLLSTGTLETNFSEMWIETFIQENEFGNLVCKMAAICLGLSVLNYSRFWNHWLQQMHIGGVRLTDQPSALHASVNRVSIGSDNSLSPIQRQAIIQTSAGLL